jgi:hypothetical protein
MPAVSTLRRLAAPILLLGALTAATGCADALRQIRGTTDEFDGAWVGQFNVVTRTTSCTITRGGVRATINGGVIEGKVRQAGGSADFGAYILESGEVAGGRVVAEFDKDSPEVEGRFEGDTAGGMWRSKECTGEWDLRKIR